jgi:signal transduction histidine kinase
VSAAAIPARRRSPELVRHAETAGRAAAYLVLGVPLGLLYVLALLAVPALGVEALRRPRSFERRLLNRLVGMRIPPEPEALPRRALVHAVVRLPLAFAGLGVAGAPLALAGFVAVEAGSSVVAGGDRYLGPWALDRPLAAASLVLVAAAVVVCVAVLEAYDTLSRGIAQRAFATAARGAVREALAESLGDRELTIAYWLPDRSVFVDEHGLPVELPDPESGRSWTVVENGGRRVAAVIHDAALEARPELVQAAATGAVLALENEQLKADLRARLEELRQSRKRIVQASTDARRRLERDLHDGAQQQLVALSLDLQMLKGRIEMEETRALVDATAEKLAAALAELRELARGIHPAVLTERGLGPSLESLAARAPVPVELDVRLERRASAAIEAAAYFLCAEALTNVVRYAHAESARVSLWEADGALHVEIEDDGVGGADPAVGSGLRGLEDRVAAVDGRLRIVSPLGRGTTIAAVIPLEEEP